MKMTKEQLRVLEEYINAVALDYVLASTVDFYDGDVKKEEKELDRVFLGSELGPLIGDKE